MSLAIGERIGVYEIAGLLGAGGMGEVYRATDTNLGRKERDGISESERVRRAVRLWQDSKNIRQKTEKGGPGRHPGRQDW